MNVENELTSEQNNSEYQLVENIPLNKVLEGEEDFDSAMRITVQDESREEIEKMVHEKLKNQSWWLQEYWQEKGSPKEQVEIQIGEHKITLYNFGQQLQQRHLGELQKAVQDFSKVDSGKPIQNVKYILLDDKVLENPSTGQEQRGQAGMDDSTIKIYPKGTQFDDYRQEETQNFSGVSDFEASIIHEFTHYTGRDFETKWKNKFGWKDLEKPKENKGGSISYHEVAQPERCVSNYATLFASDDICESMVAALRKPEVLDSERLQFIKEELLQNNEPLPVMMDRKEGAGVELPKLEAMNYRIEKGGIKMKTRKKKTKE